MMKDRDCFHGWNDCGHCLYKQPCLLGLYSPEEEAEEQERQQALIKAAAAASKHVHEETVKAVRVLTEAMGKIDDIREIIKLDSRRFWLRWARMSPEDPQNMKKEVLIGGAVAKGGGSKSKRKRKPVRHVNMLHKWEDT